MNDEAAAPKFDPIRHRRGGRRPKPERERHSCVLRIRVTPEQYWQFLARAADAHMSLSAYARATFEDNPVKVQVVQGAPPEVVVQLRIMGRNLWQAIEEGRQRGFPPSVMQALETTSRTIGSELRRLLLGVPTEPPDEDEG